MTRFAYFHFVYRASECKLMIDLHFPQFEMSTSPVWQLLNINLPFLYKLCDEDHSKSLDYEEFQMFVSKVVTSCSNIA